MPVIDIHTHIYPAKIAAKATAAVGAFYDDPLFAEEVAAAQAAAGLEPDAWGTPEQLLAAAESTPVTHFAVLGVATKPSQVESVNNFLIGQCEAHPEFIGFASMHQDFENPEAELRRVKDAGLVGIKIHPDIQGVDLDDPRLMEVYAACERLDLAVTLHTGDYRHDGSHPRRLVNVLHTFPRLRVNGAHFGGWSIYDLAVEYLEHERCFMDASSSFAFLGKRRVRELIELYGPERIMFGSDFPMASPATEYANLLSLELPAKAFEQVTHRTAEEFLECDITPPPRG